MRRIARLLLLCLMVSWLALWCHPGGADATAYRWTDRQGNIHFTDDLTKVPAAYRDQVEIVSLPEPSGPPPPPVRNGPPAPGEPDPDLLERAMAAYQDCMEEVEKTRRELEDALARDRELLDELTRRLYRTSITLHKIDLRKEREQVNARIQESEHRLDTEIPQMERVCMSMKPYPP